jgi:hypothetical protein
MNCFLKVELPPALAGGIKLVIDNMALAKKCMILAKANTLKSFLLLQLKLEAIETTIELKNHLF